MGSRPLYPTLEPQVYDVDEHLLDSVETPRKKERLEALSVKTRGILFITHEVTVTWGKH